VVDWASKADESQGAIGVVLWPPRSLRDQRMLNAAVPRAEFIVAGRQPPGEQSLAPDGSSPPMDRQDSQLAHHRHRSTLRMRPEMAAGSCSCTATIEILLRNRRSSPPRHQDTVPGGLAEPHHQRTPLHEVRRRTPTDFLSDPRPLTPRPRIRSQLAQQKFGRFRGGWALEAAPEIKQAKTSSLAFPDS